MMERIWELKEVCVNRPCLLNFENVAGFIVRSFPHVPGYAGVKKEIKHASVQLLTNRGIKLRPFLNL